ncbi:hypothetical protein ACHAP5_010399 [Fusarium lateritium]
MPAPFKPMIFVPAKQEADIRRMPVRRISAVAQDVIEDAQGGNHWCFYLSTGSEQSVLIDPTPSGTEEGPNIPGGSKACIVVSRRGCDASSAEVQRVDELSVGSSLTAGHFLDVIVSAGREKYEFEASGRGCRSWVKDQLQLFLSLGLITNAIEVEATIADLNCEFRDGNVTNTEIPSNKGMYYE